LVRSSSPLSGECSSLKKLATDWSVIGDAFIAVT
jgi:hypothetical protein